MHDTHIFKSIIAYLEGQENKASRRIRKVHIRISEFGSLDKTHFLEHYKQAICGTKWQALEIEVDVIPFGPELEITGLEFIAETEVNKSEVCKLK
jgi:Zn finger protein HypA/HybF involved in hydrogenase expression